MTSAALAGIGASAAALLGVLLGLAAGLLLADRRVRRSPRCRIPAEVLAELDALRTSVQALAGEVEAVRTERPPAAATAPEPEYVVISPTAVPQDRGRDRLVLSATLGEPLVKAAAFAYGVRRALSAQNRNRIAFEMRREVRRARRQRRRGASRRLWPPAADPQTSRPGAVA